MIKSFRHKGLWELFTAGTSARVSAALQDRCRRRLDVLNSAERLEDVNVPGFDLHPLKGERLGRYSIHVNGPWCITFAWAKGDVLGVDLEQYH